MVTKVYAFEDSFIFFLFCFRFYWTEDFCYSKESLNTLVGVYIFKTNKIVILQPYLNFWLFYDKVIREIRYNKFYYNSFESFSVGKRREK